MDTATVLAMANIAVLSLLMMTLFRVLKRINEVYHATNSMKDALIKAARTEGEAQGRVDQRAIDTVAATALAKAEGKAP